MSAAAAAGAPTTYDARDSGSPPPRLGRRVSPPPSSRARPPPPPAPPPSPGPRHRRARARAHSPPPPLSPTPPPVPRPRASGGPGACPRHPWRAVGRELGRGSRRGKSADGAGKGVRVIRGGRSGAGGAGKGVRVIHRGRPDTDGAGKGVRVTRSWAGRGGRRRPRHPGRDQARTGQRKESEIPGATPRAASVAPHPPRPTHLTQPPPLGRLGRRREKIAAQRRGRDRAGWSRCRAGGPAGSRAAAAGPLEHPHRPPLEPSAVGSSARGPPARSEVWGQGHVPSTRKPGDSVFVHAGAAA